MARKCHGQALKSPDAERIALRVEQLRRIFDQGFLTRAEFEAMKRHVEDEARAPRPRG